jgi:hypothetical protein
LTLRNDSARGELRRNRCGPIGVPPDELDFCDRSMSRPIILATAVTLLAVGCGGPAPRSPAASSGIATPTGLTTTPAPPPAGPSGATATRTLTLAETAIHSAAPFADVFQAMTDAITAQRPAYRFRLTPDRLDGDWRLDGDADDGFGAGRLFVVVTKKRGAMTANPCVDRDFTQGGRCASRVLANRDRLVLRDVVDFEGIKTIEVALIHPDRSGISAEATNFAMAGLLPPQAGRNTKVPPITRPEPVYTVTELAELVLAIDARIPR